MRRQRGFTIVEALVAFTLLATLGAVLYRAFGDSADLFRRAGRRELAIVAAQSLLDSLSQADIAVPGRRSVDLSAGFEGAVTVSIAEAETGKPYSLRRVDIAVSDTTSDDGILVETTTFRLYRRLAP